MRWNIREVVCHPCPHILDPPDRRASILDVKGKYKSVSSCYNHIELYNLNVPRWDGDSMVPVSSLENEIAEGVHDGRTSFTSTMFILRIPSTYIATEI